MYNVPSSTDGWSESNDVASLLGGADQEQQGRYGQQAGAVQERGPEGRTSESDQPGLCEC